MGLHTQLNDVSSDSIPLLLLALIAKFIAHLHSFLLRLIPSAGLRSPPDETLVTSMGSGLAGLILLTEQLNLNHLFSYKYSSAAGGGSRCVFCRSKMRDGYHVRKLDCRHVFHKECFDGWLDQLKFHCPLCRSPLVTDELVDSTRRRVGGDVVDWFSLT